jgi:hypothetical protein
MDPSLTCGEHVRRLIEQQLQRLRRFHPEVLADRDPEPLHQFRVSLRRLRSVVSQFGPALVLPRHLHRSRIAVVARATGACRDADVLRDWLEQQLMPRLDADGRRDCEPLLRQIRQRRRRAFAELESELTSGRYHRLVEELELWCESPRTTALGDLKLADWLQEWLQPCTGSCFLHAGWWATDPAAPELHALRKRIKEVRYGLEALRDALGGTGEIWIEDLRRAQSCLGDLHDQEVLLALMREHQRQHTQGSPAALQAVLGQERQNRWQHWQQLGGELLAPQRRQGLALLGTLVVQEEPP